MFEIKYIKIQINLRPRRIQCHMAAVDGYALESSCVQLPAAVVVPPAGILVLPVGHLVVGVGTMIHLQRIVNVEVFASPTTTVFETHTVVGIGKKKSSPTAPLAIPRATLAYTSAVHSA